MLSSTPLDVVRTAFPDIPKWERSNGELKAQGIVLRCIEAWRAGIAETVAGQCAEVQDQLRPWIDAQTTLMKLRDSAAGKLAEEQLALALHEDETHKPVHTAQPGTRRWDHEEESIAQWREHGDRYVRHIVQRHNDLFRSVRELSECTVEHVLAEKAESIHTNVQTLFAWAQNARKFLNDAQDAQSVQDQLEKVRSDPRYTHAIAQVEKILSGEREPPHRSKKPRQTRRVFAPSGKWRSTLFDRPPSPFANMKPPKPSRPHSVEIVLGEHTMHSPVIYGKKRAPVLPSLEDMQARADRGKDDTTAYVENGIDPDLWLSTFADAETTAMNLDQWLQSHHLQGYEYTATLEVLLQRIDNAHGNGDAKRGVYLGILKQLLNARLAAVVHGAADPFEEMEHRALTGGMREWHFGIHIPNRTVAIAEIPKLQGRWQKILGTHTGLETFIQRISRLRGYMRFPEQASRFLPELIELSKSKGWEVWGNLRRSMRIMSAEQSAIAYTNAAESMLTIAADKKLAVNDSAYWEEAARSAVKTARSLVLAIEKSTSSPQT